MYSTCVTVAVAQILSFSATSVRYHDSSPKRQSATDRAGTASSGKLSESIHCASIIFVLQFFETREPYVYVSSLHSITFLLFFRISVAHNNTSCHHESSPKRRSASYRAGVASSGSPATEVVSVYFNFSFHYFLKPYIFVARKTSRHHDSSPK